MFSFRTMFEIILLSVLQYALSYIRPKIDPLDWHFRMAITEKRLVAFDYDGHYRIVESHVYGTYKGKTGILAYQLWGESSDGELGWKRMHLNKITNMTVLDKTFPGRREVPNHHAKWDIVYLLVDE